MPEPVLPGNLHTNQFNLPSVGSFPAPEQFYFYEESSP
jgi:hypothetical protein